MVLIYGTETCTVSKHEVEEQTLKMCGAGWRIKK